jgi:hypothetical protein
MILSTLREGFPDRGTRGATRQSECTDRWIRCPRRPGHVVDREPRREGHGRGREPGERLDLAVEVGLVDVAALGGDIGGGAARREKVGGVVEPHQSGGAFGTDAELGPET